MNACNVVAIRAVEDDAVMDGRVELASYAAIGDAKMGSDKVVPNSTVGDELYIGSLLGASILPMVRFDGEDEIDISTQREERRGKGEEWNGIESNRIKSNRDGRYESVNEYLFGSVNYIPWIDLPVKTIGDWYDES